MDWYVAIDFSHCIPWQYHIFSGLLSANLTYMSTLARLGSMALDHFWPFLIERNFAGNFGRNMLKSFKLSLQLVKLEVFLGSASQALLMGYIIKHALKSLHCQYSSIQ